MPTPTPVSGFFPLPVATQAMVSQAVNDDHSLAAAVARVNAERESLGLKPASGHTSSFSDARHRVPQPMLCEMMKACGNAMEYSQPTGWLWKGKWHVKMNDGTTLKMPDTLENQAKYPQSRTQKEGLGFPITRAAATISLATGAVVDFKNGAWRGKGTGEHALVAEMEGSVKPGEVRLADSYFASYGRLAADIEAGIHCVFRLDNQRDVDFRRGIRLGNGDHLVQWLKPARRPEWMSQEEYDCLPESITVREVKVLIDHPGYRAEEIIVVTTFLDPKVITNADLADLYHRRWYCELDLRSIKSMMDMAMLRGFTPAMVEKEIAAILLAYNLIRQTMCDAAVRNGITPRDISFKGAKQTIEAKRIVWQSKISTAQLEAARLSMLDAIAARRVGDRPGRWEPRRVKERPKPHPRLMKPRSYYHNNL